MYTGQSLELADCVLTVQNVDERHTQVAMIDVRARRPAETMTMTQPQPSMASPTRLSLDRCIARGAASVIGMNEETPLDVRWNQGLIVTPWYFVETGGSTSNPTSFDVVTVKLAHVTAVCRQGLYQVERRPGSGYQLAVDVDAQDCILMTDEDAPLYDFVGVSDVTQGDLQYGGQGNLYPNSDALFLRFRGQPGDAPTEFALKQRRTDLVPGKKSAIGRPLASHPRPIVATAHARQDRLRDQRRHGGGSRLRRRRSCPRSCRRLQRRPP